MHFWKKKWSIYENGLKMAKLSSHECIWMKCISCMKTQPFIFGILGQKAYK